MKQKTSKGTIARWIAAAIFLLGGIGAFSDGFRGVVAGMVLICAAFLMSPLSTQIGVFGKKAVFPVSASIVAMLIAGAILPSSEKPQEQPTRTIISESSEEESTSPETTDTTAETTVVTGTSIYVDTTTAVGTTTSFEIDLRSTELTTMSAVGDRGIPAESSSSSSSTTKTTASSSTTRTTTTSTSTTTSTTSTTQTTASTQAVYTWVLNTSTMKFHYSSCGDVPRIAVENYSTFTGTYQQVIDMGYSPCGHCHPHG